MFHRKFQVGRNEKGLDFYGMKSLNSIDWTRVEKLLHAKGFAKIPSLLSASACDEILSLYVKNEIYRNVIRMERYRFGKGEYKYFSYPLPGMIEKLRTRIYPGLSKIANDWMEILKTGIRFPDEHSGLLRVCHEHDQQQPTPLILRYEAGGFNTLHQDIYGKIYFPFQLLFLLSQEGVDFSGGEFVMTQQVPRAQSVAHVINLQRGDGLIFTTNVRPVKGLRGFHRAIMRHGISEVTAGVRYAVGIIFHDAA